MDTFLIQLGSMSLQASVAILVVLILRKLFAKVGIAKKYVMLLWMIPFLLLICPWKISVPVGFWHVAPSDYNEDYTEYAMELFAESMLTTEHTQVQMPVSEGNGKDEIITSEQITDENEYHFTESDKRMVQNVLMIVEIIWLAGVMAFLVYAALSYILLQKKVRCCVMMLDGTYHVDNLPAPMVVGFFRPRIYLPSGMAAEHVPYVVAHEKTHIRRKDPVVKLAAYVVVCVHWFNPLAWVAFHFLEKDMEMTCDEETIQRIGTERKKEYATALLQLSTGTHRVFAVPLAFGEGDTKGRIKNVMHYKKTVKTAAIFAVATGVLIFTVFMTKQDSDFVMTNEAESMIDDQVDELVRAESEALEQLLQIEKEQERLEQELVEQEKNAAQAMAGEDEKQELTFDMVREAAANHTLHEMDFHSYSNGEEQRFDDDSGALNYYINFYYDYADETYKIGASHWSDNDELFAVYLSRESDDEMRWIYEYKDDTHAYSDQFETLLVTKESVEAWLSIELPEGYSFGSYSANMGVAGGALIAPQAYELYGDDVYAPQEWYYAGFIGQIPNASEHFEFADGKLVNGQLGGWNHSTSERLGVLDLDWQALWVEYNHDLYTAADLARLEEDGVDTLQIETTSDYWYFFFAKEGEERAYYLSLSQKLFTKEEALAIAETVDFKE